MRNVRTLCSDVQLSKDSHTTTANTQLAQIAVSIACIAYCCWVSKNILHAWQVNHFDQWGWIAALIWLTPIGVSWFKNREDAMNLSCGFELMAIGVFLAALGHISTLNVAANIGLVIVLGSLITRSYKQWPWLLTGVCWIPAFGWLGTKLFVDHVLLVRILVACLGLSWMGVYYLLKAIPTNNPQPEFSS